MQGRVEVLHDNIPQFLVLRPQWVCWRWEQRDGKPTKAPISAVNGQFVDITDPTSWSTFDQSRNAYLQHPELHGIGYVLSGQPGDCLGVDLDDCYADNQLQPWSSRHKDWSSDAPDPQRIVGKLATYAEVSPSGKGVKLLLRGEVDFDQYGIKTGIKPGDFEMYRGPRFFTVTGRKLPEAPAEVRDVDGLADKLLRKFIAGRLERKAARNERNGQPQATANSLGISDQTIYEQAIKNDKFHRLFSMPLPEAWGSASSVFVSEPINGTDTAHCTNPSRSTAERSP